MKLKAKNAMWAAVFAAVGSFTFSAIGETITTNWKGVQISH